MGRFTDEGRIVFSSDEGRHCPECRRPQAECACDEAKDGPPSGDGVVRVRRETKGRNGKTATTISGVPLGKRELQGLTKELKQRCGCGGSLKDGVIELQGDRRDTVVPWLEKQGYRVKRAGG